MLKLLRTNPFIYTTTLLATILLYSISCSCNQTPSTESIDRIPKSGIWHTGNYVDVNINATPRPNSPVPDLYTTPYNMYQVKHDGSCGYRAFLPILLGEILTDNKWKPWLGNLITTIYTPGKNVIENVDLSGTNYMQVRPTDDPDKLLQDTKSLFQKLTTEAVPRKLEEAEIQLLVKFMRQIVLMNILVKACNEYKSDMMKFNNLFSDYFSDAGGTPNSNNKEFWATAGTFKIFNIPFYLLSHPTANRNGQGFMISYLESEKYLLDTLDYDILSQSEGYPKIPMPSTIGIILYQHGPNGCMFEYLVPKESN